MVSDTLYLQNELGDLHVFFYINCSLSNSSQSLKEIWTSEDFGRERP